MRRYKVTFIMNDEKKVDWVTAAPTILSAIQNAWSHLASRENVKSVIAEPNIVA